jgi:2-oxo-4-hydroxy-4-carboxy--5-ureidoimidazoline (OHCU) decarboxylase
MDTSSNIRRGWRARHFTAAETSRRPCARRRATGSSRWCARTLNRLTPDELAEWRALNRDYRERFGFPLVVCVREHTKDSILAWGRERLDNDAEQELDIALGEVLKIARLRLEDLR